MLATLPRSLPLPDFDALRRARARGPFAEAAEHLARHHPGALLAFCLPQASERTRAGLLRLGEDELAFRPCFGLTGATCTVRSARAVQVLRAEGPRLGRGVVRLVVVPGLGREGLPGLLYAMPLAGLVALRLEGQGIQGRRAVISASEGNLVRLRIAGDDTLVRAVLGLPALEDLRLCDNRIGPAGAAALAGAERLRHLDLRGNAVGDTGAAALAAHPGLQDLRLEDNCLTASGAGALAEARSLRALDLSRNTLGDVGARALAAAPGPATLRLRGCGIGDAGAQALLDTRGGQGLDLRDNPLSSALRATLAEAGARVSG